MVQTRPPWTSQVLKQQDRWRDASRAGGSLAGGGRRGSVGLPSSTAAVEAEPQVLPRLLRRRRRLLSAAQPLR